MQPIDFPEANHEESLHSLYNPDESMGKLPVCFTSTEQGVPLTILKYKASPEELEKLKETGEIWVMVVGRDMQPINLYADSPFADAES